MKKDFGKNYSIYFYTLIDASGNWEKQNDELVVNVGLSTNPNKVLKDKFHCEKRKNVYVLLVKETLEADYTNLIENIEEIRSNKSWFKLEPLSDLIKKKAMETKFKPYTLRKKKVCVDKGAEEVLGTLPI